jgi:3-oxoacyl-[acyl-carrier protein] reductase
MSRPIAIVTGASGGIGRACALALAPQHDLALQFSSHAAHAEALAQEIRQAKSARAEIFQSDLSQKGAADALVGQVAQKMGAPAVLIHAAGQIIEKPIAFTRPEDWDALFEIHSISAALLSKAMLRYLRKIESGRIVYIGSLAGEIGLGNGAAYAAAKGALNGLCKSLALEAARWKTTINVIAPGFVETHMTEAHDEQRRVELCKNVPLGRYGKPEEIGALAAFLCSPAAAYITGQTIIVDGGMSLG